MCTRCLGHQFWEKDGKLVLPCYMVHDSQNFFRGDPSQPLIPPLMQTNFVAGQLCIQVRSKRYALPPFPTGWSWFPLCFFEFFQKAQHYFKSPHHPTLIIIKQKLVLYYSYSRILPTLPTVVTIARLEIFFNFHLTTTKFSKFQLLAIKPYPSFCFYLRYFLRFLRFKQMNLTACKRKEYIYVVFIIVVTYLFFLELYSILFPSSSRAKVIDNIGDVCTLRFHLSPFHCFGPFFYDHQWK